MLEFNLGDKVIYRGKKETIVGIDHNHTLLPYLITCNNNDLILEDVLHLWKVEEYTQFLNGCNPSTNVIWVRSSEIRKA